ncbi:MAG: glycosyltransferase family 4 protein [Actinomycetota bacterium]
MRVMMLTWDFPPQATGGTASHVTGLATALSAAGHEVVVVTVDHPRADRIADADGPVRVFRADADLPWIARERRIARVASANHALVKLADVVEQELDCWFPDVVHGHDWTVGWAGDALASKYDVPFVLTMHGTESVRHGGNLPPGEPTDIASIEWWLAFQADRLIAPSRFVADQLVESFELSPEFIDRVPNGIDPAAWAGDDHSPDHEPLVVSWGRVQYEKGFQVLARAMSTVRGRVPEVRAVIGGRGSYLPELQTQIDVEGVSDIVELTGFLRDHELRALVHRAGVVVIPSLYEPFGIVALEALAAGAPLVVARTGGLAELVAGNRAALTFEPGDADDLARCIELVLGDAELRGDLVANARRLVERDYAWRSIAAATVECYGRALRQRLTPVPDGTG